MTQQHIELIQKYNRVVAIATSEKGQTAILYIGRCGYVCEIETEEGLETISLFSVDEFYPLTEECWGE